MSNYTFDTMTSLDDTSADFQWLGGDDGHAALWDTVNNNQCPDEDFEALWSSIIDHQNCSMHMPNEMDVNQNGWFSLDQTSPDFVAQTPQNMPMNATHISSPLIQVQNASMDPPDQGSKYYGHFEGWTSSCEASPQVPALDTDASNSPVSTPRSTLSDVSSPEKYNPTAASSKPKAPRKMPSRRRSSVRPMAPMHLLPKIMPNGPIASEHAISPHIAPCDSPSECTPDVSLPSRRSSRVSIDLSTDKRAYHKLAEQNRRNRLNNAIKELESLIPASLFEERNKAMLQNDEPLTSVKDKSKSAPKEQTKADVMELAIEYITKLRATLDQESSRLRDMEKELGAMHLERNS